MKNIGTINNRITATNGKFRQVLGTKDATFRYGQNIPHEMPDNFSAGYVGSAIHQLSKDFLEAKDAGSGTKKTS